MIKKSCEILGLDYEENLPNNFISLELFVESCTETKVFLQVVDNDDQNALFSVYPQLCEILEVDSFTMPKHGTLIGCKLYV
ncbi:hypothetical protein D1R32_gp168 [Tunisvirus fontaine2]|uniref:Uncharacterized protein n=1 Tax=Tunisvirus fontaine2 TaxID=1421067 RepID=V9SDS9_9VIRU|nr:hypothetical protein D1R32_gp168 [Tunisvirus fontaine2]AHC54885.1 hypothetical protein TNS_ORF167 [Tunisvirus fontaine2]